MSEHCPVCGQRVSVSTAKEEEMDLPEAYEKNSDDEADRCDEIMWREYQRGLTEGRKQGLREAVEIVRGQAKREISWFASEACLTAAKKIEAAMKEAK